MVMVFFITGYKKNLEYNPGSESIFFLLNNNKKKESNGTKVEQRMNGKSNNEQK
jgi:hypothetical protein